MEICFDLDGTICSDTYGDYKNALPYCDVVSEISSLYSEGHTIKIYTARGSRSGISWNDLPVAQLKEWGVMYHTLIMGKPSADVYIDDKALNVLDWRDNRFQLNEVVK